MRSVTLQIQDFKPAKDQVACVTAVECFEIVLILMVQFHEGGNTVHHFNIGPEFSYGELIRLRSEARMLVLDQVLAKETLAARTVAL